MKVRLARVAAQEASGLMSDQERGSLGAAGLGPGELSVFSSIKAPKRRLDWFAGRMAVKRLALPILAERGEKAEPRDVEVRNRKDGSPFLVLRGDPVADLPVSLSHGPLGAVAASAGPGGLIGVDAETVAERPASFVSIFAHESERTPEFSSPEGLMRLWTLKEAVLKLLSLGLSVDLWDVRFPAARLNGAPELHGRALSRWQDLGRPAIRCETRILAAAPCAQGGHPRSGGAGRLAVPAALGKDVGGRPGDGGPLAAEVLSVAYTVPSNSLNREERESVYRDSGAGGVHA